MLRSRLTAVLVGVAAAAAIGVAIGVATSSDEASNGDRAQGSGLADLRGRLTVSEPYSVSEQYMNRLRECRTPRSVVLIPRGRPMYCDVLEERGVHPDAYRIRDEYRLPDDED